MLKGLVCFVLKNKLIINNYFCGQNNKTAKKRSAKDSVSVTNTYFWQPLLSPVCPLNFQWKWKDI